MNLSHLFQNTKENDNQFEVKLKSSALFYFRIGKFQISEIKNFKIIFE